MRQWRKFSRILCLVSILVVETSAAAQQPALSLSDARARLEAKDPAAAIEILKKILQREPDNSQARFLLGRAFYQSGQAERAIDTYRGLVELPGVGPQAMYNLGCSYAVRGKADSAFAWLARARDSGGLDMDLAKTDKDLATLRKDARFRELVQEPSDFADPFQEPGAKILFEWRGEAAQAQYGWIARDIGDVDGDGVRDVTTSAPTQPGAGPAAGKVYVYSGASGELIWSRTGDPQSQLGLGIEAAGDVNADGVGDVLAGAPGAGKAIVYSGRDGSVLLTFEAQNQNEFFGRRVSDLGDVDGDGHDEVLIGAPAASANGEGSGRVYLFSGRDGRLLKTFDGERAGDRMGAALAGLVAGEHRFIVVGAPDAGAGQRGRVYVYSGPRSELKFTIEADGTAAELGGMFVSVLGDVDADGTPDIYASDWSNNARGRSTGRVYVHSGADGRRLLTLTGEAAGDGFGIGPADAGDTDGDGHDDLIIGAWQHSGAARSGGKVYLYSGKDGTLLRQITCKVRGDTFGFDATGVGDVNGDGIIDFLLTSAWSNVSGFRSGRMFILAGN